MELAKAMQTSDPTRPGAPRYRECFVSQIQFHGRRYCSLRFPELGSHLSIRQLVNMMEPAVCEDGSITLQASSDTEAVFSLANREDAHYAYKILMSGLIAEPAGVSLLFIRWWPTSDFGFDVAEHRVCVSITNLPLHVWRAEAVEHILAPYCALECTMEETDTQTDLMTYRCMAWAQRKIPIPTSILLCIPVDVQDGLQHMDRQPYRRMLTYRINLELNAYIDGKQQETAYALTTRSRMYDTDYSTDNAVCYLPPELVDQVMLQELSSSLIADCSDAEALEMRRELYYLHPYIDARDVNITAINAGQQIIKLPPSIAGITIQDKILDEGLSSVRHLQPWTPNFGAMQDTLRICVQATISGVPPFFCTRRLMQLFLGQSCYMEGHDIAAERMLSCRTYRCIAWCQKLSDIPQSLLAKVVLPNVASKNTIHPEADTTLRTARMTIKVRRQAPCNENVQLTCVVRDQSPTKIDPCSSA